MIELKDQMNRAIRLENFPERIVSLVPSQTELLFDLGLENRVVGITKFCIHPNEWFKTKTRVGGTKNLNLDSIDKLNPDLIIGNKEENTRADIEHLEKKYPVYMSDIYTVEDALEMITHVGTLTNAVHKAEQLTRKIETDFQRFNPIQIRVLYLIWANPFMAAGPNTFIGDMIKKIGLQNCISNGDCRYPELSLEQMKQLNPDVVLLSSEPFPFGQMHAEQISKALSAKVVFVDGEVFSWYGSRLLQVNAYVTHLLQRLKSDQQEIK